MDVREKLVEILKQAPFEGKVLDEWWWEEKIKRIADHLISNGVTVQEWIPVNERGAYTDITSLVADVNVNEIADHIRNGNLASWVKSWQRQMAFEIENLKLSEKD